MANLAQVESFIADNKAALLYFKNDSCGPCQVLRPKVEELIQSEFPKMKLLVVDSQERPELNGHYAVFSNPTLLIFFEGKEYLRKSKYISITELQGEIARLYGMAFD